MRLRRILVYVAAAAFAAASEVARHGLSLQAALGGAHPSRIRPVLAQQKPRMLNQPPARPGDGATTKAPIDYAEDLTTSESARVTTSTTNGVIEDFTEELTTTTQATRAPSANRAPRDGSRRREVSAAEEEEIHDQVTEEVKHEVHELEDDVEKRIKKDMEKELREEKEAMRKEFEEEMKEVKKEAREDIEREVKEDLAEEGLGREERVSRAGEVALNMKWNTFLAVVGGLALMILACSAMCYWLPNFGFDFGDDEVERGVAPLSASQTQTSYLKRLLWKPIVWSSVLCPFGIFAYWMELWSPWIVFMINLLALVPMTYLMGIATEEFALHMGDKISALLNASLGNVVELIFVYLTLRDGLTSVCIGTIVGSILGNHLVLLGFSFLLAGKDLSETRQEQVPRGPKRRVRWGVDGEYNATNAINQSMMLIVASFCTALPSMFAQFQDVTVHHVVVLSRAFSIFILIAYLAMVAYITTNMEKKENLIKPKLSIPVSSGMLTMAALVTMVNCEILVKLMGPFCMETGLSQVFVGVVILPLIGDLAHGSAVYVSMKGNLDLAVDICFMSAIQVALVVMPIAVCMGYMMNVPFSLNFRSLHSVSLMGSAIITFAVTVDGRSNWLRGYMLLSTFGFIAALVFFMPDPQSGGAYMG